MARLIDTLLNQKSLILKHKTDLIILQLEQTGMPAWLSSWASVFGSGHDPDLTLRSGDQVPHRDACEEPAAPSAYVSASLSLSLSVSHE